MAVSDDFSAPYAGTDLPRAQAGPQPQYLLLVLLADYWRIREPLPSQALVRLLADFDVSEASARAAIGRLTRRGHLELTRDGRRTCYRLTERTDNELASGLQRTLTFGERRTWDGHWTVVLFSVPEDRRDVRHSLRARLRWLGFAPLHDGSWVTPNPLQAEAAAVLTELDVDSAVVLTAVDESPRGRLLAAWDLESVAADYRDFLQHFTPLETQVRAGAVGSAQALRARTELMEEWRNFRTRDPDLPGQLLPQGWPQEAARRLFTGLYDGLGPLAAVRFRQLLSETAPELVNLVRHYNTESLIH
jgi:phenylacetic acid degradation operon negative regulatory protein